VRIGQNSMIVPTSSTAESPSKSGWQSIVICDGVTIASVKETAAYLLFVSGWGSRISRSLLPTGREILSRVALYLALTPTSEEWEKGQDDALNLVLCHLLDARRKWRLHFWGFDFPWL